MKIEFRFLADTMPVGISSIMVGSPNCPMYYQLQYREFETVINANERIHKFSEWTDIPVVWK